MPSPGGSVHPMTSQHEGKRPGPLVSTGPSLKGPLGSWAPHQWRKPAYSECRERARGGIGQSCVKLCCKKGKRCGEPPGKETGFKSRLFKMRKITDTYMLLRWIRGDKEEMREVCIWQSNARGGGIWGQRASFSWEEGKQMGEAALAVGTGCSGPVGKSAPLQRYTPEVTALRP